MIVYGHRTYSLNVGEFRADVSRRLRDTPASAHDRIVDLFVDFGEGYAAAADAACPHVDDLCPELSSWHSVMAALAEAVCGSLAADAEAVGRALRAAEIGVEHLAPPDDAATIEASTAEGFAYYALYPDQYVLAAEEFLDAAAPSKVVCLGLRAIGAPLAHLVAAAARRRNVPAAVVSSRPRGHPFDRRLRLSARLQRCLAEGADGHAAVVDEGPGLSGSSFAAGLDALRSAGFPDDRIMLFPSWHPDAGSLRSARGRDAFRTARRVVVDFERAVPVEHWMNLSGGRWRSAVFDDDDRGWPAVHPQHERRKYRSPDRRLVKRFIGLGRRGTALRARAETLAASGLIAVPRGVSQGFLTQEWVDGRVLARHAAATPETLDRIADYAAFLAAQFRTERHGRVEDLIEMIRINCEEAKMPLEAAEFDRLSRAARTFDEPEVAVDGRMQAHEWITTSARLVKADALDHHDDDFLPGCRDIAWDLAGAIVEWLLDDAAASALVDRYARRASDRSIVRRLPFYTMAYTAYRLGYATLAAESLAGTADGLRFNRLRDSYRRSLAAHAHRPAQPRRC